MTLTERSPDWKKTVGKGEIARYEQFLLFPLCSQKACFPGASKGVIVWEWVNVGDVVVVAASTVFVVVAVVVAALIVVVVLLLLLFLILML